MDNKKRVGGDPPQAFFRESIIHAANFYHKFSGKQLKIQYTKISSNASH